MTVFVNNATILARPTAQSHDNMTFEQTKAAAVIVENGVEELTENEKFRLDLKDELGTKDRVQIPHPEIFQALHEGAHLLINDGKI